MNVAAFIFGLVGVAINFFPFAILSNNNNPFGDLGFAGFFFGWLTRQGELFFFLYGIFGIVFTVNQIVAIFGSYHALMRNRNKNVPGFFKFTAYLCFIEAAVMFYVYSMYMDAVRSSGLYGLAGGGIAPYVPMILQVVCFALASALSRADEAEDKNRNSSNSASSQTTQSSHSSTQSSPFQKKIKTFEPVLGVETEALIKRAFIFMADNDFDEAERYFEQALRQDPENSQAYLGKLMAELKVHNTDELIKIAKPLKDEKLFQRALNFAKGDEKTQLESYVETQEQNFTEQKYIKALDYKVRIASSSDAQNVIKILASIVPYKDSETLIQELEQKKEELEALEKKYMNACVARRNVEKDAKPDIEKFNRVAEMFEEISDYKDSKSLAEELRRSGVERVEKAKKDKRDMIMLVIILMLLMIAVAVMYAYNKISERKEAERAQQARIEAQRAKIEAEKNEEKSRIEALKLELQGQK